MTQAQVTGLTIYPVKSLKGIALEQARLTPAGLDHDRRFLVVRPNGRFVTQRELPGLALIETELTDEGVRLSRSSRGEATLPFQSRGGDPLQAMIWGTWCEAIDEGDEVSRWLTAALECDSPLRLVRMADGFVRPQGKPEELGENTHTFFADAAPFLVANEASLEALNEELSARGIEQVPMNRFRPNIVVRGLEPFSEHRLGGLRAGSWGLNFCHPCERCVVTTIDQETGRKDPDWQPFRTLKEINPVPGERPAPAFGQNAVLEAGEGATISIGDKLVGADPSAMGS